MRWLIRRVVKKGKGSLRTILVAEGGGPIGDYTPDYYPLSLGSASNVLSGRVTVSC